MSVDKHTLQSWVAGAELRLQNARRPFANMPWLKRIKKVAERTQGYALAEKIGLTRARHFSVQVSAENFPFASIKPPVVGKQVIALAIR